MDGHSGSARFQVLFESALQAYEKKISVKLAEHPLAIQLQRCDSVEDITTLLQGRAQAFNGFQGSDRIMKSINTTVSILTPLSDTLSLADAVGLVTLFPPTKAIHVGLGILLDAANGIISSCEVLADLLESIEHFVHRLKIYTEISPTPAMDEILVKLIVELISTMALVTRKLKQRRALKWVKNFFGVKDIKAARQRLVRLTQDEIATTAAQTLEVVHGHVKNMKKFMDGDRPSSDGIRKVPDGITSHLDKSNRDRLLSDIRSWLSPPDPWKNYNIARESRHRETGTWFIKGNNLSEWKASGPSSLLWIHGKPGAGKSVLCSTIIEDTRAMNKAGCASLAIYYYDFREDQKKDLRGLLSSVLFQLCDQSNSYYSILSTFYSTHRSGAQSPSDNDLVRCFTDLLNVPGQVPVYLIVDALDECPSTSALSSPRERVLSFLEDLIEAKHPNLRICVTSRPETDIKTILEPLSFRSVSLHNESGQNEDIQNYIESVINTNRSMHSWNSELKQLVIDVLTKRADGMFRWAYCQLEYLADCLPADIRHALDTLPATLDETYERTLREIKDTKWKFARRLLFCVAVASHPLRVEELAEILAFDFEAGSIPKFREDWRLKNPAEAVLSTCSTLLSLVNEGFSQVVQFSHFSVKEFLTSSRFARKGDTASRRFHISMTPAHTLVTQACLGILFHLDESVNRDSLKNFPLAIYAARHWFEHARFEGVSQGADEGIKRLFDQTKPHLAIWLWIYDPTMPPWEQDESTETPSPPRGTPIHYAAFCGLHDVVEILAIDNSKDVSSRNFLHDSTPLHLASREGHAEVARHLVEHGADAGAKDNEGSTPLHHASIMNRIEVARLLVKHGADIAAQDKEGWTPLHQASGQGHVGVVRLLVEHGANISAQDNDGWTPLHRAANWNHAGVAQLLVEYGAGMAAKDKKGWTSLHVASSWGAVKVALLLVKHGANTAARDNDGRTPLHCASKWGYLDVAELLIEHGANLDSQDNNGRTSLHLASDWGTTMDPTQLLIEHGADIAFQDKNGRTPLHEASARGNEVVVSFLVKCGADTGAKDKQGCTPLHLASEVGHVDVMWTLMEYGAVAAAQDNEGRTSLHRASDSGDVKVACLLIEHGADMAAQDNDGWTSLHRASDRGHVELVQLLLVCGADTDNQDNKGWKALHRASDRGDVEVVRLLIEHGADVVAKTNDGWTPLHRASDRGHLEVTQVLLFCGADLTCQDNDGWTPLHWASKKGDAEVARLLIKYGADAAVKDNEEWTSLHLASHWGHLEIVQLLIDHGADVASQDKEGLTPLHWASERGHVDVVQLLVEHDAVTAAQDKEG